MAHVEIASGSQTVIDKPRLLLVEGKNDKAAFEAFIDHWGFEGIQIVEMEGIDKLYNQLELLVSTPGFKNLQTLGIVCDADNNAQDRFQSVRNTLDRLAHRKQINVRPPAKAGTRGKGCPPVAVFIAPDNTDPGNLETMLNRTKEGDKIDECIDSYFDCLEQRTETSVKGALRDKARAQARIAVSSKPDRPVGRSVQASGVWDLAHHSLGPVKNFLSLL